MAQTLSLCRRNGGITQFGQLQGDLLQLPATPDTRVKCPDGATRTRAERLTKVADVPKDDRGTEVANALAVAGIVAVCSLTDVLGMSDLSPYANALLFLIVTVGVLDNFYDVLKMGTSFAADQLVKDKKQNIELPDKDTLPFGLGSGQATGNVVRGFSRLLTIDAEREAMCEGAALFAAYGLGLPCFAYRPNALEASVLVVESARVEGIDTLLSSSGILRVLVWLLAPVAAESSKYPACIISNPKEAESFLERLEDFAAKDPSVASELWWMDSPREKADLLKWAYTEADLLLRENRKVFTEVSNRLSSGAATIGDCVAVIEDW